MDNYDMRRSLLVLQSEGKNSAMELRPRSGRSRSNNTRADDDVRAREANPPTTGRQAAGSSALDGQGHVLESSGDDNGLRRGEAGSAAPAAAAAAAAPRPPRPPRASAPTLSELMSDPSRPPPNDLTSIKYQLFTAAGRPVPPASRAQLAAAAELLEAAAAARRLEQAGPAPAAAPAAAAAPADDGGNTHSGLPAGRGLGAADDDESSQPGAPEAMEMSQQQPQSQQPPGVLPPLSQEPMDMSQQPQGLQEQEQEQAAQQHAPPESLLPEYASWPVLRLRTLDGPKTAFVAPSMVGQVLREHGLAAAAPKRRGGGGGGGSGGGSGGSAQDGP
ncbi:hypothetical protein PLESTF_000554200 [Pleodorina starrii]|nr:hypothetical protein PLESTM_001605900 [Pleodorina starrii]GLC67419.1 hypothetical protein PLESTF_000554200 [Pleodorina starrii]